jgi:type III secretion system chaperone SycN
VTPAWLNDIVREFGSGMGLKDFALNADGAAALRFENGVALRLEYAMNFLSLSMSVESPQDVASVKLLLTASDPLRRGAFAVRTGIAGNPLRAVFTVRLEPSEVTLGNLDAAMAELWRATENFSRRLGS